MQGGPCGVGDDDVKGGVAMKSLLLVLICAVAAGLLVPAAIAGKPAWEDIPPTDPFMDASCGFPVLVEFVVDERKILFIRDGFVEAGALKVRFTNEKNGRRLLVDASGPTFGAPTPDGSGFVTRHVGRTIFAIDAGLAADLGRSRGIFLATGPVVVRGTFEDGITSITQVAGTWTDLCPDLV
jgi:hypothetical protein